MKRIDRGAEVNLARTVVEYDSHLLGSMITRKGIRTLAEGILKMDKELTRLYKLLDAPQ